MCDPVSTRRRRLYIVMAFRLRTLLLYALALAVSVAVGTLVASMQRGTSTGPQVRPVLRPTAPPPIAVRSATTPMATRGPAVVPKTKAEGTSANPAPTEAPTASEDDTLVELSARPVVPRVWHAVDDGRTIETELVRCASVGMQDKCLFRNIALQAGTFIACGGKAAKTGGFPNPIFLPDGQRGPLVQYHKYRGHKIRLEPSSACRCSHVVPKERPVVFTFRMSGHSTYHLWENNLGPFYATLQEFSEVRNDANDRRKLLVAFADDKPTSGPKAPHLLDQLLRTFSDYPLINASRVADGDKPVCFERAILGTSANSFPHMALLHQMMRNIVGYAPPPPLPPRPRALFISRNHKSVIRGRKIANEADVVAKVNATLLELTGDPLQYVQMETLKYKEQVALAMRTNIMISPHGGGVANCIWMAKGSVMVEFVAPVGKTLLNMYHSMCGKSGVKHISFLADPDPADANAQLSNPRLFSNMVVPPAKIAEYVGKAVEHFNAARAKQKKSPKAAADDSAG